MFDFPAVIQYFAWVYRVWCLVPFISNVQMMITDTLDFSHFVSTGYTANFSRSSRVSRKFSYGTPCDGAINWTKGSWTTTQTRHSGWTEIASCCPWAMHLCCSTAFCTWQEWRKWRRCIELGMECDGPSSCKFVQTVLGRASRQTVTWWHDITDMAVNEIPSSALLWHS